VAEHRELLKMPIYTPDDATQVEGRIKTDVQREAPDSNPYLPMHWLRSLIAGLARRIFDLYRDLHRTERRLFPDTADSDTAPIWGGIYVGPPNAASGATGVAVASGTDGATIPSGTKVSSGANEYESTSAATISAQSLAIASLTSAVYVAYAETAAPHGLTTGVPVTVTGATGATLFYNVADVPVTVTGPTTFTYPILLLTMPAATGSPVVSFAIASVPVASVSEGARVNLPADAPLQLQSPLPGVATTLYVTETEISGGTQAESLPDYKARYLDKIRNPVAHFNVADIVAKAKEVPGVTRVFVQRAGSPVSTVEVSSIERFGSVAVVVTATPHLLHPGNFTNISGALQAEYNVEDARVIVIDANTFAYAVEGAPATPATGAITATSSVPLGQVIARFMRDNDSDPIPSPAAVATTKAKIEEILPANTATGDNIVEAPVATPVDFLFSSLTPDNASMREAVANNLAQFFEERTRVGAPVDADLYRAAIANTVDPANGSRVEDFSLVTPPGDVPVASNGIATLGTVGHTS